MNDLYDMNLDFVCDNFCKFKRFIVKIKKFKSFLRKC